MTGDPARFFKQSENKTGWVRNDLVNKHDPTNRRAFDLLPCTRSGEPYEEIGNAAMFEVLLKYHSLKSVLCASGSSGADGLHTGHAYSILDVRKITSMMGMGTTTRL